MAAHALIERIREELTPEHDRLVDHPYLRTVEAGIDLARLRPFAGEQHAIIASDLRSVARLVARFGDGLFLHVLDGERAAWEALPHFASALGMTGEDLEAYEPLPGAHAYAAYMAWLASHASAAEVAGAYLVNFATWGESCARMATALKRGYGLTEAEVRFFDLFAEPDRDFEERALEVVASGLEQGVPERRIARAARLLQGYELLYWDTLFDHLRR
ncbi:MAG TPA: iron-containing redox enzyme family protein [Candidatus Dormibacteraeota bacterium]|nr:iron-containing redox enzyme family protein [Candidatus Dormibacteraeota bacterium]